MTNYSAVLHYMSLVLNRWDSGGMQLLDPKMIGILKWNEIVWAGSKFLFGTEDVMQGWLVGDLDGNKWGQSHSFWNLSHLDL